MATKKRINKKLNCTLSPATHTILNTKPNKSKAIDEAVQGWFTPVAKDGRFSE